jgi:hypothetical protein
MNLRQTDRLRQACPQFLFLLFCSVTLVCRTVFASSPVTLTVSNSNGVVIPDDFIGLSFETSIVLPGPNKIPNGEPFYLFSPTNQTLIAIFKNLGIKNLRVGGGTVDYSLRPPPGPADVDQLFGFAKAAGIKVIFSFRLLNGNPTSAPPVAAYIWQHFRPELDYFAVGNEPDWRKYHRSDLRITNYPSYLADWRNFAGAIHAAVPDAPFAGPDTGSDYPVTRAADTDYEGASWTQRFADDEKNSGIIGAILHHDYVGQLATGVSAPEGIDALLSSEWVTIEYPALYKHVLTPVVADGLPYRMTEANDRIGGVDGASNAFASALWALDYMHWWAAHGCIGINFHNNEWLKTDTVFLDTNGHYHVNPKAYGIKAFDLGSHGSVVAMAISNSDEINLTAYAVRSAAKLYVTVINKEHNAGARSAEVTIVPGPEWKYAEIIFLTGRPGKKTGITLGGASIQNDGSWNGSWKRMKVRRDGNCLVRVPAASAVIARFSS